MRECEAMFVMQCHHMWYAHLDHQKTRVRYEGMIVYTQTPHANMQIMFTLTPRTITKPCKHPNM